MLFSPSSRSIARSAPRLLALSTALLLGACASDETAVGEETTEGEGGGAGKAGKGATGGAGAAARGGSAQSGGSGGAVGGGSGSSGGTGGSKQAGGANGDGGSGGGNGGTGGDDSGDGGAGGGGQGGGQGGGPSGGQAGGPSAGAGGSMGGSVGAAGAGAFGAAGKAGAGAGGKAGAPPNGKQEVEMTFVTANIGRDYNTKPSAAAAFDKVGDFADGRTGPRFIGWQEIAEGDPCGGSCEIDALNARFKDAAGWDTKRPAGKRPDGKMETVKVPVTSKDADGQAPVARAVYASAGWAGVSPTRFVTVVYYPERNLSLINTHFIAKAYSCGSEPVKRRAYWQKAWGVLKGEVAEEHTKGRNVVVTGDLNRARAASSCNPKWDPTSLHPDARVVGGTGIDYVFAVPANGRKFVESKDGVIDLTIDSHNAHWVNGRFLPKLKPVACPRRCAPAQTFALYRGGISKPDHAAISRPPIIGRSSGWRSACRRPQATLPGRCLSPRSDRRRVRSWARASTRSCSDRRRRRGLRDRASRSKCWQRGCCCPSRSWPSPSCRWGAWAWGLVRERHAAAGLISRS